MKLTVKEYDLNNFSIINIESHDYLIYRIIFIDFIKRIKGN